MSEIKNLNEETNISVLLEAQNLAKDYGGGVGLLGMDLALPKGKIVGLLGSNGSGKTTFLKLVAGILTPTAGVVSIDGIPVSLKTKELVAYLPERTYLNDWMRVSEIVEYFADFYEDFDSEKAFAMLADLGVDASLKLKTLSKGTKEKVQLVLVMARRAKLYLLDEPIAGVDPVAREYILDTIFSNYNKEATVIISTHLIADIEPVLDDFIFIHRGRVLMRGDVAAAKAKYGMTLDGLFREVYKKCSGNA